MRVTLAMAQVLRAFLEDPSSSRYGLELMRETGLASGSLYPILARLERAGWVRSRREQVNPAAEGRPARRYYQLTAEGMVSARYELAALVEQVRPPLVPRCIGRTVPDGGPA